MLETDLVEPDSIEDYLSEAGESLSWIRKLRTRPQASPRTYFAVVALAALAWQGYAVMLAWRSAPTLSGVLEGLGSDLPAVTRTFLATYRLWPILSIVTAMLIADVWRRKSTRPAYSLGVVGGSVVSALVLHAWLHQTWFEPVFDLMRKLV